MDEKRDASPVPFFIMLKKTQKTTLYTSYKGDEEHYKNNDGILQQLQYYVKASNEEEYNKLVKKFPNRMFRRTKGEVYEMFDEGNEIDLHIALQVKGHSLTWYFWKPNVMDQYPQQFRDVLYNAAAQAHKHVSNGCDLYYRGSNSVHIKLMHHLESEAGHNHNHYRLKDNQPYTPEDFKQHMNALKDTEAFSQFFEEHEIEEIIEKFEQFHAHWHEKPKAGGCSRHEEYMRHPSQQLNAGDVIEIMLFGYQQEPCRINVSELRIDYEAARKKIEKVLEKGGSEESQNKLIKKLKVIEQQYTELLRYREKGGSRGLLSEIGPTRQTYHSESKPTPYVGGQDSSLGIPPEIPSWAKKLKALVEEGKQAMIKTRAEQKVIDEAKTESAINDFEREIPEHVRKANMQKKLVFFQEKDGGKDESDPESSIKKDFPTL
ncbi:hypothetical protein [Legionella sp. WA2022007384]